MKLHIGCGDRHISGFVNVDVRAEACVDIVANAADLSCFKEASVDYIYARHTLEHLDPLDAENALSEFKRVLRPQGTVHVVVPDLKFHAWQYLGLARSSIGRQKSQESHALAGFYGWRRDDRGGANEDAHRWGYSFKCLRDGLHERGFIKVRRNWRMSAYKFQDARVDQVLKNKDLELWHLNVIATKQ